MTKKKESAFFVLFDVYSCACVSFRIGDVTSIWGDVLIIDIVYCASRECALYVIEVFANSFAWVLCGAVYVCWNKTDKIYVCEVDMNEPKECWLAKFGHVVHLDNEGVPG